MLCFAAIQIVMVSPVLYSVLLSLAAGSATGLGAIPLTLKRRFTHRFYDSMMGLSAGVMLSASAFSLIEPALKLGALQVIGGTIVGALFVAILNWAIPHVHTRFTQGGKVKEERRRGMLIAGAVAIHNLPEGFAVGVGYLSGVPEAGLILALAIMIHNMPEGFAVAYPFHEDGKSTVACLIIATLSGLVEPVGALLGALLISVDTAVLPFGLGFAAGAMIYVVFAEIIPESHSHGYSELATLTAIIGFILVVALDLVIAK
jgi:ZIP family zinc transporter